MTYFDSRHRKSDDGSPAPLRSSRQWRRCTRHPPLQRCGTLITNLSVKAVVRSNHDDRPRLKASQRKGAGPNFDRRDERIYLFTPILEASDPCPSRLASVGYHSNYSQVLPTRTLRTVCSAATACQSIILAQDGSSLYCGPSCWALCWLSSFERLQSLRHFHTPEV